MTSDTSWEHAHELVAVGVILSPVAFESLSPKESEKVNVKRNRSTKAEHNMPFVYIVMYAACILSYDHTFTYLGELSH